MKGYRPFVDDMQNHERNLEVKTRASFAVHDITDEIRRVVRESGIISGLVTLTSMHTTCAISVNECEERLLRDIEQFFLSLASPDRPWKHNDLHLRRDIPPDEPKNAHAHLIAMMLGNGETLAVRDGKPCLGRYQSVLLVELDGPRNRTVAVQVLGVSGNE